MATKIDCAWLGFDSRGGRLYAGDTVGKDGEVPPGTTIQIIQRPQVPWRGSRLFVHQPIASNFLIHEIYVGNYCTTVAAGSAIPADAFATKIDRLAEVDAIFKRDEVFRLEIKKSGLDMLGAEWPLPIAHPGCDVRIMIENIARFPHRFIAGFLGQTDWMRH